MKYILNDNYALCGYKGLPFALYDINKGKTHFFTKEEYSLLLDCDGQTEINIKELNEDNQKAFRTFIDGGFITISEDQKLKDYQEYYLYENYYKDGIQFSITGRCNYKCKHCFMSAPHAKYDEMSLEDCIKVIDELNKCGIRNIQITGGEPLAHPQFKEIIKEISKKGLHLTTLYTNGLLLKQDIYDLFKEYKQHPKIQISFDGIGFHDWMRGVVNAEKYAIDAIKLCIKNNFECEVAMVVFKDNIDSLRETVKYLDELGVSNVRVSNVYNQGEWLPYVREHGLTINEVFDKYLEYIPQYLEDKLHLDISLGGLFNYNFRTKEVHSTFDNKCNPDNEDKYLLCKSIKQSFYITSTGLILPCASMMSTIVEEKALNILNNDLKDIINSSYIREIGNLKAKNFLENNEKCNKCKYKYECLGGCRARALIIQNDLFGHDEDICTYFLEGYKEKKDKLFKELNIN